MKKTIKQTVNSFTIHHCLSLTFFFDLPPALVSSANKLKVWETFTPEWEDYEFPLRPYFWEYNK